MSAEVTRLIDLLPYQLTNFPQEDCLAEKKDGQWKKYNTQQVIDMTDKVARAFVKLGLQPQDKVAIISNNRPEWNFVDVGMLNAGLVNVPIYPTISAKEYEFIFNDAEIKVAFISDAGIYDRVKDLRSSVSSLQEIYSFDKIDGVKHFSEFLANDDESVETEVQTRRDAVQAGDLATIIYTSGTTGLPKGVMLSHNNIVSNLKAVMPLLPASPEHRCLSFLPLCHIFERVVVYSYFYVGASVYYAESLETIKFDLLEVKPHFFTSVPRLLEKVYETIETKSKAATGIKRKLALWAIDLGMQFDDQGKNSAWYNFKLGIARKLVFSKWQEALGGNVIGIVTGAAALQVRLAKVFNAAGIRLRQGYGQTETSPVITLDRYDDGEYHLGSVGQVIPGVQVKLADNGEILAKGPNVMMGYYKRPDITNETIEDGWIHTGDVGEFIDGKYLKITDRVKELFKTSGGKYVAPQVIENKVKESNFVEQLMIVGENRKFVSALIVPAFPNVRDWCKQNGVNESSMSNEELIHEPNIVKMIEEDVYRFNPEFNKVEQIKRIKLLSKEWGVDSGELTPTMKVKRRVVLEKYKVDIEDIYNV